MKHLLQILLFLPIVSLSQNFNFEYYSVREGLPQASVTSVFQDSRHILWIGTRGGGLASYDGRKFTSFDEKDGFENKLVEWITEDKKGNLLIGSAWGSVTAYDGNKFWTIPCVRQQDCINNFVEHAWKSDTLFLTSQSGLFYYYQDSIPPYE